MRYTAQRGCHGPGNLPSRAGPLQAKGVPRTLSSVFSHPVRRGVGVSKVGGIFVHMREEPQAYGKHTPEPLMPSTPLSPEREAEAQKLADLIREATADDFLR